MKTKRGLSVVLSALLGCALCSVDAFSQPPQEVESPIISGQWSPGDTDNGRLLIEESDDELDNELARAYTVSLTQRPVSEGEVEGVWKVRWNSAKKRFEGTGSFNGKIPGNVPMELTLNDDHTELRTAFKFSEAQKLSWIRAIYHNPSGPIDPNAVENFQRLWLRGGPIQVSSEMPDISGKWRAVRGGTPVEYTVKPIIDSDPANRRKNAAVFSVSNSSIVDGRASTKLKWLPTSRFFVGVDAELKTEMRFKPNNDGTELRVSLVDEQFAQDLRRQLINQAKKIQADELTQTWTLSQPAEKDEISWLPKVVQPLRAAVVSIVRIDRRTGLPTPFFAYQTGIVVDPRGYILTYTNRSEIEEPQFKVQFLDKSVRVAELIENEDSLTVSLLKVDVTEPIPAISLKNLPQATSGTRILGVTAKPRLPPLGGRITSDGVNFGGPPHNTVALDVMIRQGEGGCLATTDRGEPLAILLGGSEGQGGSYAIPLLAARDFIEDAIGEPGEKRRSDQVFVPGTGPVTHPQPPYYEPSPDVEPERPGNVPAPVDHLDPNPQKSPQARPRFVAVPDTADAKQLLSQLEDRESAAAAQVERIRRLQADDQDKQDVVAIAQGQKTLKSLLNEAFDLKLQLEELQVKELHSRLSQLERQIGQRKALRDKIIERRANELMEGEVPSWQPRDPSPEEPSPPVEKRRPGELLENRHSQKSGTDKPVASVEIAAVNNSPSENIDAIVQSARKTMSPFVDKVAACQKQVRARETAYYQDRSNAVELQKAWDALSDARRKVSENFESIESSLVRIVERLGQEAAMADEIATMLKVQRERKSELHNLGSISEAEMKSVIASSIRAADAAAEARRTCEEFQAATHSIVPDGARELWSADDSEASQAQEEFDDLTVLTWLERSLKLKLEFVQFHELNLPFKAALRVRESSGDYQVDDLIVMSGRNYSQINSLNQLANGLCGYCKDTDLNPNPNVVLRGGLSGPLVQIQEPGWKWTNARDHLLGITPSQAIWHFEVRASGNADSVAKTGYVSGVCVSLDGLVAILCPVDKLVDREKISVIAPQRGLAQVVAADKMNHIALLKITLSTLANRNFDVESAPAGLANHNLFHWVKCRTAPASSGQAIKIFDWAPNSNTLSHYLATVATAKDIENRHVEPDGSRFLVVPGSNKPSRGDPAFNQPRSTLRTIDAAQLSELTPGSLVTTNDKELQGILDYDSEVEGYRACVPASLIDQLLKDYRRCKYASH